MMENNNNLASDDDVFGVINEERINDFKGIASDYKKLLEDSKLSDITLVAKSPLGVEKRFKAHKIILAARSSYFEALFFGNFRESLQMEIEIADVDLEVFELVLQWIYTATITVTEKHVNPLMELAGRFDLQDLAKQCESFTGEVLLTKENVLEYLGNSFTSNPRLKEKCLQFIELSIKDLMEYPEFLELPREVMSEILKRSTLDTKDELEVFKLIMAWYEHNKAQGQIPATTLDADVKELIKHVRLPQIKPEEIVTVIKPSGLFTSEQILEAICMQVAPNMYPAIPGDERTISRQSTSKPELRVLMLGLDASGKTTILYMLKLGEVVTTIPTIGFNVESVPYKGTQMTIWDVGAQPKIRPLWRHYTATTDFLIWVVDSNDRDRLAESKEELDTILRELDNVPVLVLANKQDLPNAASVAEIAEAHGLHSWKQRQWYIQATCATSKDGLTEGLDWIMTTVKENMKKKRREMMALNRFN